MSSLSFSNRAPLPRLNVLYDRPIDQPEQGKVSKAFNAALQAISKAFSVATPKLHALVTTNYQAARQANESINARVLNEVAFNDLIDYLVKELDSKGATANIVDLATEYMRKNNLSIDVRSRFFGISLTGDDGKPLTKEELKTNLLTAKLNAQSCAGVVVGFTNLARSLMTTAGMNNPGSFSNVDESIRNTFQAHEQSKTEANRKYRELEDALNALEELFGHLTNHSVGRTGCYESANVNAEFKRLFDKFKELMPAHFTELAVRGAEEADAPMLRFYQDLLKPNSVYLGHLKDTILSVRNELIEASKELDRVNREARPENFVSRDKKLNPFRIFKGVFSVISHATFSLLNPIKSLAELSFQSLIDKSSGSKFAGIGTITLVAFYIIAEVGRFVVALAGAGICMVGAIVVFGGNKGVYMARQGFDSYRDKQKPVRPDLSVANQAMIEDENRQTNLLTGLRLTDFYQAYEAAVKMQALGRGYIARKAFAKAKEAAVKLQRRGKVYIAQRRFKAQLDEARSQATLIEENRVRGEDFIQKFLVSLADMAKATAFKGALEAGKTRFVALREADNAGKQALQNLIPDISQYLP